LGESQKKRIRREPEAARKLILDVTEKLMLEEGYAAVSTRRVAKEAELAPALVHYYYPTTDDLFIALHRRMTDGQLRQLEQLPGSERPLEAYWKFQTTWAQASLGLEFVALANHRKTIREEIVQQAEQSRDIQTRMLEAVAAQAPALSKICPPVCMITLLTGVARTLVNEQSIGITRGHEEVRTFMDWAISQTSAATEVRKR
jgi:TetR/AcrR family transcriptional regulator, regulator of autoinduction and epiphytic fitness